MQIPFDDIAGGERLLRKIGEEKLIDDARTRDADGFLPLFLPGLVSRMGCHHDPAGYTCGAHWDLWTVVQAAHGLTFGALLELIGRQVQTCLNERVIQHAVLVAAHDKGEASQIGEHSSQAILSVKPHQRALLEKLMSREVACEGCERFSQFFSILPVAFVSKTAEPVIAVSLADGCAGTNHLPPFAACVARSTYVIQSAKGWRQIVAFGHSSLPRRFSRPVDVKDGPGLACSIRQATCLVVRSERAAEQVIEKQRAQSFNRRLRQRC